jgi:hypothetical protein
MIHTITRREFLRVSALTAGGAVLSACAIGNAVPTPTLSPTIAPIVSTSAPPTAAPALSPQPNARALTLSAIGEPRTLPARILGASAESLIERLIDDPRKVAAIQATAPAIIRFPGGSQSNYYNWRDGLLHLSPQPHSSSYYMLWANAAPRIAQTYPNGISYEQYFAFANQIGSADIMLVPNLETSSVEEQVAWFKKLASENMLTHDIELGNEFWIAMGGDPNVMRVWQNEKSSMDVMHRYEQALRPIAGAGAKFAVQASAASFSYQPNDRRRFIQRLVQWDQDLAPADWFQAVTAHLYPDPDAIAAQSGNPSPQELFALMMGREDAGTDHVLNDIAQRVPGKEIWVTEWSPRGGKPTNLNNPAADTVPPPMNAQLVARATMAMLRHPQVTVAQYFTLYADNGSSLQAYVPSGNQFLPMAPTVVLGWFNDAANGGSTFQRVVEMNGRAVENLGPFKESYQTIEGALFHSSQHMVLILQNASSETRVYDPTQLGQKSKPTRVELLVTPDLGNTAHVPAQTMTPDPKSPLVLPPLSIARIIWE